MGINLKAFQLDALLELHKAFNENKKYIILESATGSGKTVILSHFIDDFMKENSNYVTVWLSPGKGNLEEQSKNKMSLYLPMASTKDLQDALTFGFVEGDTVFINWELVTKKGNKALSEGENKNLLDVISVAHDNGLKFLVVVDEEHLNKTIKAHDILQLFKPVKVIRASATPKSDPNAIHITIPEQKIMQAGLIKNLIVINENLDKEVELTNQVSYLIDLSLAKQEQIKNTFVRYKSIVNPLIIVQLPNSSDELLESVERHFYQKGLTYENNQLAVWLSEKKENLDNIDLNTCPVRAIIIKQAIATGWDCPRAHILVKLRENMSESFEIQTIGRIRRMPEARHYNNPLLDSCYLYTLDEKFKEGVKEFFCDGAFEATTLILKEGYKEISFKKEKIDVMQYEVDSIHALRAFGELLRLEYGVSAFKYLENIKAFISYGFDMDTEIKLKTYQGELSIVHKKNLSHLNHVTIKMLLDTHEHGRMFHHIIARMGRSIGLSYDSMSIIIRRLFCKNPKYSNKILDLEPKLLYAFIINNGEKIEYDLKRAMSSERYNSVQMEFTHNNVEEDFYLPRKYVLTYDTKINNFETYNKNVYENYISSAAPRSQGEKLFERYCEECSNVDWFYKNGDKGNEFFSIVYYDNSSKKHHFYPDYIISVKDEIWIVEVKGGESADGRSEDIDPYSAKKMHALLDYINKHNLKGGFVRYNKSDMRLYINTTIYSESMENEHWVRLNKVFI